MEEEVKLKNKRSFLKSPWLLLIVFIVAYGYTGFAAIMLKILGDNYTLLLVSIGMGLDCAAATLMLIWFVVFIIRLIKKLIKSNGRTKNKKE